MSSIVSDRIFKPSFGSEIARRKACRFCIGLERTRNRRKPLFRANRSTDHDPHPRSSNKPDHRVAVLREPAFNARIYDLKRRRIPTVSENKLACFGNIGIHSYRFYLMPLRYSEPS